MTSPLNIDQRHTCRKFADALDALADGQLPPQAQAVHAPMLASLRHLAAGGTPTEEDHLHYALAVQLGQTICGFSLSEGQPSRAARRASQRRARRARLKSQI